MNLASFGVRRPVAAAMLGAALVLLGLFSLPRFAVALLPSFTPPTVSVSIDYPNVAPETMENAVTRPLENAIAKVGRIETLESTSYYGTATFRVSFVYGTDINQAAVDIEQQIAAAKGQLPNDPTLGQPIIVKANPNALPVVQFYLTDAGLTQRDLGDLASNDLANQLSSIAGVAAVDVGGALQRAIMVEPDQAALAANGVTTGDIVSRIQAENVDIPAGLNRIGNTELQIRTSALLGSANEVGDVPLALRNGASIRIRDVANVKDASLEQRSFTRLNGRPAVSVQISAQPSANIVDVANRVYAKLAEMQHVTPALRFGVVLDQRDYILQALGALEHAALYGAILAVVVILVFLHSWRSTLIVAVSLPISVLGTCFAAYLFGQTINTMTLAGLALATGLVVDDAIVVIENISRWLAGDGEAQSAAEGGTAQVFGAVVASTATIVVVFVPLLLVPGLQGLIFGPFAIMVMTAVAISLFVALAIVPMLVVVMRIDRVKREDAALARFGRWFDAGFDRLAGAYRRALHASLERARLTTAAAFVILVATIVALAAGVLETEVFPPSYSRFVRVQITAPSGIALAATDAMCRTLEAAFLTDPHVAQVGSFTGSAPNGRLATNKATLAVALQPHTTSADAVAFARGWRKRLDSIPLATDAPKDRALRQAFLGSEVRISPTDIVQQQIAQGSEDIAIQIFGPDNAVLLRLSTDLIARLGIIDGIVQPRSGIAGTNPEEHVSVDRMKLLMLGLDAGRVAQTVNVATGGTIAGYYRFNGQQYPIYVQLPASARVSEPTLARLSLAPGVTLGSVAQIDFDQGPSEIGHLNKLRTLDMTAPVLGARVGTVKTNVAAALNAYPFPPGYRWEFGPSTQRNSDLFSSLVVTVALAILLIYMLLAAQFESFALPMIILASAPLAGIGIVIALLLTHRAFGLTALIGSLMLVGIAVKNSILIVEFARQRRRAGADPHQAMLDAATIRLRPILMTSIATIGGMLPLALGIEAGSETQAPLATVVIGGLISSTVFGLFVIPALYVLVIRTATTGRAGHGNDARRSVRYK